MDIKIVGKNIELTEGIKTAVQDKLGKLGKYFTNEVEVRATVRAKKARQTIEVTIIPISGSIIRAEQSEENLYAAIDGVVDKLSRQLRKYKTRLIDKGHQSIRFENISEDREESNEDQIKIVRRKKFGFKPMSEEEAILQMELLGHNFFVFTNAQTDEMNIVYKRKEGDYGIIEPE
ncbi:putative sigma-54 modulation protein [Alkalithermobacter thermoalcaliphilus JW-YL-7 = DSM 7308]|uniref:Ribosome hibernation promoting factor n=1 Tax=Alkalithermobacter thermoalcaliphilus JW-YL-7 = DSM 7308 TaxID=1121328 RepID=A0A150FND3_CLOPD|nr:sigma 54 modulation protein/ribosomal protein S30EA [[Clostridium] paradoxum JW-YL-7 = DSM 7308]SHL06224.1 putative sigma-54 modulation protein [[Clostridium] paradoxum JW-YL-7 = DSM 7308]